MTKVQDVMTQHIVYSVGPDTAVDDALAIICNQRISGLPVVDDDGRVIGIVSDFDLLNLEGVLGEQVCAVTFFSPIYQLGIISKQFLRL